MRNNTFPLDVKTAVAAGNSQRCQDLREKYIHFVGPFSATFSVEGSFDNTNWFTIQAGINAPGTLVAVPQPASSIRINTTAWTSGSPKALLAGFDANG